MKYRLKDSDKVFNFCIAYSGEQSKYSINLWLRWSKLLSPKNFDSIMDVIYEICPHP